MFLTEVSKRHFLIILSVITLFRIWYIWQGPFDLTPDEAHYWEWSRRLDLSYYSKGPAVAYIIAFFTKLGGNNEVSVRLGAVIISAVASLILYILARDIFNSERVGLLAGLLPHLTPLYAAGSVLMTTDAPLILFWGLTIYFFRKAIMDEQITNYELRITNLNSEPRTLPPNASIGGLNTKLYWYLTGVCIGLGLLSKYTMALIFPCFLLYLLFYREDRHWLKKKEPYIAFIISLIIFSPVIVWNIQHDFVTLRHTMGQAHVERGPILSIASAIEFLGSQIGLLTPFIFLVVVYGIIKAGIIGFKHGRRDHMLLFFTSAPVFLFFVIKSLQAEVEANWAAPAYLAAFISIGIYGGIYERFHDKKWFKAGFAITLFIGFLATVITHFPGLLKLVGVQDLEAKAPINRIIAWEELGLKVGGIYSNMTEKKGTFIFSDTYQMTSELAFYVPGNPVTYNINLGNRRMNQYDIWGGFDSLTGKDAVYVKGGEAELEAIVEDAFEACMKEPVFVAYRGDLIVRKASIFRCYNFKGISAKEIHRF